MTREQAINSMISHGFTVEQAGEIIKAVTLQEPTTKNDCEHCSKTYGTLGCCDFVNNEPVYSCKEGHEEYARGIRKLGATTKNDLGVDCIKKSDAINIIQDMHGLARADVISDAVNRITTMPSVTPQEPRCKECKWWKDSDGKYRRGCGAESQCPINRREVYEGNGYCYMFESQESEKV